MIFESGFDGYKIISWRMLTMTLEVTIRMRRTNGIYVSDSVLHDDNIK